MLLDPYDVLDQLAEFMDSTLAWCDKYGEYGTGMHSFSDASITKMRKCVDAAIKAFATKGLVKFPDGMDCTEYLTFRGESRDEVKPLEVV